MRTRRLLLMCICFVMILYRYLVQHWHHTLSGGTSSNDQPCTIKCVRAQVPQQNNYYDCGLFMLHYVEMFLRALQSGRSKIQVSRKWFNPEDVATKRNSLQRLIKDIQEGKLPEKGVLAHADTPLKQHFHNSKLKEGVSEVEAVDLLDNRPREMDAESSQRADNSYHSSPQTADTACCERICCQTGTSGCYDQLGKVSGTSRPGTAIKGFDEDGSSEPSVSPIASICRTCLTERIDKTHMGNVSADLDVSREQLNKELHRQAIGISSDSKELKTYETHVSAHELDDYDESYRLLHRDKGAAQKGRRRRLHKEQDNVFKANNHADTQGLDREDHGISKEATESKCNLADEQGDNQYTGGGHFATANIHHARDQPPQSLQVYISSDEDSGFVKVRKMVDAAKLRQQTRGRKFGKQKGESLLTSTTVSERVENQPLISRWRRLRRKSSMLVS